MLEGYTTVSEIAKRWEVKPRTIQIERPVDERIKSGKYIKDKET